MLKNSSKPAERARGGLSSSRQSSIEKGPRNGQSKEESKTKATPTKTITLHLVDSGELDKTLQVI